MPADAGRTLRDTAEWRRPHHSALLTGNRLHLSEGPIDLVIWADGEPAAVAEAYRAAERRFDGLLAELVAELPLLRAPLRDALPAPASPPVGRDREGGQRKVPPPEYPHP